MPHLCRGQVRRSGFIWFLGEPLGYCMQERARSFRFYLNWNFDILCTEVEPP